MPTFDAIDGRPNTKGGTYHINLLPTTCHVYFGSVIGATPDGRRGWTAALRRHFTGAGRRPPRADRRAPLGRQDGPRRAPAARCSTRSSRPKLLADDEGLDKLVQLVRTYFRLDGHHIQFNVVDAATLRAAQQHPEQYRDLIVRVAGYSDYFCDLGKALQDEIIARTEHQSF